MILAMNKNLFKMYRIHDQLDRNKWALDGNTAKLNKIIYKQNIIDRIDYSYEHDKTCINKFRKRRRRER
jgi:hypothetical protein